MAKSATLLATQSAAANATSGILNIGDLLGLGSIQIVFTGANVVGTLQLQGSVDATNWADLSGQSKGVSNSVGHLFSITPTGVQYFRVTWTYISGTGNITITGHILYQ